MTEEKAYQHLKDALEFLAAPGSGWLPIYSAPRDGRYVLLAGPSGYTTVPIRVEVCRYDETYRPLYPWVNHANNSFLDGGSPAIYWRPLSDSE